MIELMGAITFLGVLEWVGYILLALLCLMFMIVTHEFGHYIVGKTLGFKIDEFSVGFGPAIIKYTSKKSGELFALRCVPLGGYCAFHGENSDDDKEIKADDFNAQKPWKRILVFIAGAGFNFICALVLCAIFFTAYGESMPKVTRVYQFEQTSEIVQNIKEGDIILEVEGKSLYNLVNPNDLINKLNKYQGKVEVTVLRNNEKIQIELQRAEYEITDDNGNKTKQIGFGFGIGEWVEYRFDFVTALGRSFIFIFKLVGLIFSTLGGVITGALGVGESLGGTVTAVTSIVQISKIGFKGVLYAVCVLSANLAVMNLLPIPALDGSHVVFTLIEWVRGKPINRKVENIIHTIGIMCLFALAIILDIVHFVG